MHSPLSPTHCTPCPKPPGLTLQSEVHDAGVQGVHLGVHVSADVEEVPRSPAHGRLGKGPGTQGRQGMKRWGLGRRRGVWGQVCLWLDLVVQGDRLQGQGHQWLWGELGDSQAAVGCGHCGGVSEPRGVRLPCLARTPAAFWPVRDEFVQLLCRQIGEGTQNLPCGH